MTYHSKKNLGEIISGYYTLKQTQRTIYYLIYGSNNEKAAKNIMDYVMDDKKLYKYLNKYIKTLEEWGKLETEKNKKIPTIFDFDKSKD